MALNLVDVQDQIYEALENAIPYPLVEQGVPDADTVRKVNGKIEPYIALQFGDLQRGRLGGETFAGVRTFDYELPIYIQVCSANARMARQIAGGVVLDALLGLEFEWTGEVRKRPGGGMFSLTSSNGATECYMMPSSWAVTVQINDV